MQNIRMAFALLTLCLFSFFSCEKDTQPSPVLILQAIDVSTGTAVKKSLPGTDLEVSGNGFTMAFFDKITGQRLGYLMDITVASESFPDGSMKAENYTIFEFEADNSTLVLHNFIEMAPIDASTL